MRKFLLSALCMLFSVMSAFAVGAYPVPCQFTQSDGTILTIVGHGDEDFHYVTTIDGVLLVRVGNDFMVGRVTQSGELEATSQLAHNASNRSAAEQALVTSQQRELFLQRGEMKRQANKIRREPLVPQNYQFPHTGSPKAIIILAEFSDVKFTLPDPKKSFNQYFNSMTEPHENYGYWESDNLCSVKQYFNQASMGQFTPEFDVYGPITLSETQAYYGGSQANGADDKNRDLVKDACLAIDEQLDFSQYDANNDGAIDLVYVVFAGYSESFVQNPPSTIWPVSGTVNTNDKFDGKLIRRYGVSNELNGFEGSYTKDPPYYHIAGIGLFCHEFSHCMGLPDFYPTVESAKGDNQAMEYWSIMDSGCYLINGNSPCGYTAWEREAMGWATIETLTADQHKERITLNRIEKGGTAYRILNDNDDTGREYLIVEDIQQKGLNRNQKGHGMLVYHVEYREGNFALSPLGSNTVNNQKGHPRMTVIPADNLLFAQYNIGKTIDGKKIENQDFYNQLAGDPFPGTSGVTELSDESGLVNLAPYLGDGWNKALKEIEEDTEAGTISFTYYHDATDGIDMITTVAPESNTGRIYSIDGRYMGTELQSLPKGIYVLDGKKVVR